MLAEESESLVELQRSLLDDIPTWSRPPAAARA